MTKPNYPPQPVTAIWLRNTGNEIEVLAELDGEWRVVIRELYDGLISHIAESSRIARGVD